MKTNPGNIAPTALYNNHYWRMHLPVKRYSSQSENTSGNTHSRNIVTNSTIYSTKPPVSVTENISLDTQLDLIEWNLPVQHVNEIEEAIEHGHH